MIPANAAANRPRRVKLRALYDCEQLCGRGVEGPGDDKARAANRCALPGFDRSRWASEPVGDEAQLLAQEVGDMLAGRSDDRWDLETDGCPKSHELGTFAQSLVPYLGTRTWDGQRTRSLLLERAMMRDDEPGLLWEAVQLYEAHEDGAFARAREVLDG